MTATLSCKNEIGVVVRALEQALRYAFLVRLGPVANLAALRTAFQTQWDRALCFVTAENRIYEWIPFSTLPDDNLTVIAPDITKPGRWIRVETTLTYGPNDNAPLINKATGFIRTVEVWDGSSAAEDKQQQIFARSPALLIEWSGDNPEVMSQYSGSVYRNEHTIDIGIVTECLRRAPSAAFGSPVAAEKANDPGIFDLIGLLRWFLAGSKLDTSGIDFVEIGASEVTTDLLAERWFLGSLRITVRTSFSIDDEDLEALTGNVQPKLTNFPAEEIEFDPSNWVSSGLEVVGGAGPGLTRTISAGLAFVAGATVTYAGETKTFTANSDTYRDLLPNGTIQFIWVPIGEKAPPIPAGALRIAITRTGAAGVIEDFWLCGRSVDFGSSFPYP